MVSAAQVAFEPEDFRSAVRSEIESVVGVQAADQVETMLSTDKEEDKQGWLATLIRGIVVLTGATGLFAQLQATMNDVWEVQSDPKLGGIWNFISKRLVSLGMILTLAILIMVSITASSLIHAFDDTINQWLPGGRVRC